MSFNDLNGPNGAVDDSLKYFTIEDASANDNGSVSNNINNDPPGLSTAVLEHPINPGTDFGQRADVANELTGEPSLRRGFIPNTNNNETATKTVRRNNPVSTNDNSVISDGASSNANPSGVNFHSIAESSSNGISSAGMSDAVLSTTSGDIQFTSFEQILERVNAWGRYQITFAFLTLLTCAVFCGNYVFMSFAILEPTWACNSTLVANDAVTKCEIYNVCDNLTVTEPDFHSFVTEWHLFCDSSLDRAPTFIVTVQLIGALLGSQVCGYLADHWGRRMIFLITFTSLSIACLSSILLHNWKVFTVFRFAAGFFMNSAGSTLFTWGMELTSSKHNVVMNMATTWAFAYMFMALVGYLTADWRIFLVVVNLVALCLLPCILWFKESPRWLIQMRRFNEACESINQILRTNKGRGTYEVLKIHPRLLTSLEVDSKERHYTMAHLFATRQLVKYTMMICLIPFTAGLIANLFLYNLKNIGGNPFLDIFFYGLLRSWMPFWIFYMDRRFLWFGRRVMFLSFMTFVTFCCFVVIVCEAVEKTDELVRVLTPFGVGSAVAVSGLWIVLGQFVTELYPTVVRNIAQGFSGIGAELGGIVAPILLYLARFWPSLPYTVALGVCVLALGAGYFLLPETKNRPLPDTLHALEQEQDFSTLQFHKTAASADDFNPLVDEDELGLNHNVTYH